MHPAHGIKWIRRKSYRAKWLGKAVWQLVAFGCLSLRPRDILPLGRLLAGFGFDQVALGRLLWCSRRLGGSRGIGEAPPTSSMGPAGGRGRRRLADFLNPHRIANHCLSSHRLKCEEGPWGSKITGVRGLQFLKGFEVAPTKMQGGGMSPYQTRNIPQGGPMPPAPCFLVEWWLRGEVVT